MNTKIYETTRMADLPACWIYQNKTYTLFGVSRNKLPQISEDEVFILEEFNIPKRLVKPGIYEYWREGTFEEEEVELPLYVKIFDKYRDTGKTYTQRVPTAEMVIQANDLKVFIYGRLQAWRIEEEARRHALMKEETERDLFSAIMEVFPEDKTGIGVMLPMDIVRRNGLHMEKEISYEGRHFKIFPVDEKRNGFCFEWNAIFDMDKARMQSVVKLYVPKGMKGWFIGYQGKQLESWSCSLLCHRIKVIEMT